MNVSLPDWTGTSKELTELLLILQVMAGRTNTTISLTVGSKSYEIRHDEPLESYVKDILM